VTLSSCFIELKKILNTKTTLFTIRGDYFQFGSVFIKNNNQTEIFFKKTKTGSNRPVSVRFGFLEQKPVLVGFLVWLVFFRFGSVFLV
jgi:hypothetical protein